MASTQQSHHYFISATSKSNKIPVPVIRNNMSTKVKNSINSNIFENGLYSNCSKTKKSCFQSVSLQSTPYNSPLHQKNTENYSHSTNCSPHHEFCNTCENNYETNNLQMKINYQNNTFTDDQYSSLDENSFNSQFNNNLNSSNDELEYDNSEESNSNDGDHTKQTTFTKRLKKSHELINFSKNDKALNSIRKNENPIYMKHSQSYHNNFFEMSPKNFNEPIFNLNKLAKPTSLSLSGNNLRNVGCVNDYDYSPNSNRKYESFIMTGEYIINLSTGNSQENPLIFGSRSVTDLKSRKHFNHNNFKNKSQTNFNNLNSTKTKQQNKTRKSNNSDLMRQCLSPDSNTSFDKGGAKKDFIENNTKQTSSSMSDLSIIKLDTITNEENKKLILDNNSLNLNVNNQSNLKTSLKNSLVFDEQCSNNETNVEQTNQSLCSESKQKNLINNNLFLEKSNTSKDFYKEISENNSKINLEIKELENKMNKWDGDTINSKDESNNNINEKIEIKNKNSNEERNGFSSIEELPDKRYPSLIHTSNSYFEMINQGVEPSTAIELHLNQQKNIDTASAKRLATRLYNLDKFKKSDVSRHLSKNNDFSRVVAEEYLSFFNFTNIDLIESLRLFLSKFCLIGETQERERVLLHFAKRFHQCNPTEYISYNAVHTLACALMILNNDLHGVCVSRKMTINDFIENLKGLNDGQNYPKDLLKNFYNQIKVSKLEWSFDDDFNKNNSNFAYGNGTLKLVNTILEVSSTYNSFEYKKGYILRKSCYEANGKRTPLGKRKWKLYFATLRDTILYLHKDDQGLKKSQIYDSVKNSIKIHHAFAMFADEYVKKKFVFMLRTADGAEYLISVNNKQEMESWMDTINFIAGCLSAPPLPAPISSCSKKKSFKYILPVNTTKFQFKEQLADHEARRIRLNEEITELTNALRNNKSLVGKQAKETILKIKYLKSEHERYTAYTKVMKKIKPSPQGNGILEKASKSLVLKPKPLNTSTIGEEQLEEIYSTNNEDETKK